MDLSRPQILSLYIIKLFQNGRYLRPWWCMLYVLGRQWISMGICCHLSTPQCQWYVTISNKPNESILSFLPLTSVPDYDLLQLLTSLWWSNFLFKLKEFWVFSAHPAMFLDESKSMSHLQVGIHTSGLLSYHSLWVPNTYHGLNSLQSAYNCVQQSSWRLSFFLSFFFWVQWASLIGPWLQGNKKNSETLDIPPNRGLYTQNQILVINWSMVVVWEPTCIFWTRPPPTRQCWVLIFTSCKTAYIAGGDKVTANNYGFGTWSKGPASCEAHWKHAIRGS